MACLPGRFFVFKLLVPYDLRLSCRCTLDNPSRLPRFLMYTKNHVIRGLYYENMDNPGTCCRSSDRRLRD